MFDESSEDLLILLLENGADINKKNKHHISPKNNLENSMSKVLQWIKQNKTK
jgi:hypothetical protein